MATGTPSSGNTRQTRAVTDTSHTKPQIGCALALPCKEPEIPVSDSMSATTPFALVFQHEFRRRLNDLIGLALLASATMLSFTGLVDLSRSMHPVRFVLVLCTTFCLYRVLTGTFVRLRLTDTGIERSSPLRRIQFRPYDQLAEIAAADGKSVRLRFKDGSILTIDRSMRNASELVETLRHRAGQLNGGSAVGP